jgi:hypothetical protein
LITLPELPLDGLKTLTDEVGMLQHSKFSIIDRHKGYTTDDNARALISAIRYNHVYTSLESLELVKLYLAFLLHMQKTDGSFSNLLGYDRSLKDKGGSEECMGRALWACGTVLESNVGEDMKQVAKEMFDKGLPSSREFKSPRARAYTILGLKGYHVAFPTDSNIVKNCETHATFLTNLYFSHSEEDWIWFEPYLTYVNARLSQSLFHAHNMINDDLYLDIAVNSIKFLVDTHLNNGFFMPVGTNGWYMKKGKKGTYDQQPIEASCMVEALIEAYHSTDMQEYVKYALRCFNWYHGANIQGVMLFDPKTSACFDGITPKGLNKNQGAESTLSYYMAYLALKMNEIL